MYEVQTEPREGGARYTYSVTELWPQALEDLARLGEGARIVVLDPRETWGNGWMETRDGKPVKPWHRVWSEYPRRGDMVVVHD